MIEHFELRNYPYRGEHIRRRSECVRGYRPASNPISFWTEQDILEYLRRYNLPYASVYGEIVEEEGKLQTTGCTRTGCVFCGFGCHLEKGENRFQRLKRTHPQLWSYCMDKLGMREVLAYINVPIE